MLGSNHAMGGEWECAGGVGEMREVEGHVGGVGEGGVYEGNQRKGDV